MTRTAAHLQRFAGHPPFEWLAACLSNDECRCGSRRWINAETTRPLA